MTSDKQKLACAKWYAKNSKYKIAYYKKYCKTHPEIIRNIRVKSKLKLAYGITVADKRRMYATQHESCAICFLRVEFNKIKVDHNHKTKQLRGLLCNKCNTGIGLLKEKPANLVAALAYLNRYNLV